MNEALDAHVIGVLGILVTGSCFFLTIWVFLRSISVQESINGLAENWRIHRSLAYTLTTSESCVRKGFVAYLLDAVVILMGFFMTQA